MSWSFPRARAPMLEAAAIAAMLAVPGAAQTVPRLTIDAGALASSNPLLLPGGDAGAVQMEVSARPGVGGTLADGSTFDLGAVVTDRAYSRRYGNVVVGNVAGTGEYRRSEYLSAGASASFSRDLAVDLLTSSVEASADPTSIRSAYRARLWITAHPDARSWLRPEVGFERSSFTETGLLGDTRAIDVTLAYTRRASARTRLGVRTGAIFNQATRLSDTSTQLLYGTIDRQLNTRWRLTGELGVERNGARTEIVLGDTADQRARVLASGRAELCRVAPGPVVCVRGSLNSEVSGLGGLQRRAVVATSFRQRLGASTVVDLAGEYQRAVMQGDVFPDFDAIRTVGVLERAIGRDLTLAGTIQYLRRRLIVGQRIGAAFAGLRLTWSMTRR